MKDVWIFELTRLSNIGIPHYRVTAGFIRTKFGLGKTTFGTGIPTYNPFNASNSYNPYNPFNSFNWIIENDL